MHEKGINVSLCVQTANTKVVLKMLNIEQQ